MHAKKIAIAPELHRQLVAAIAAILGIRETIIEKSFETFLSDLLEHLAADRAMLGNLLSSGARENAPRQAQTPPEDG